jgi:hypothetical protein
MKLNNIPIKILIAIPFTLLLLSALNTQAYGYLHLTAKINSNDSTIDRDDIDDIYIKFDKYDNRLYAVIILNNFGKQKIATLLNGNIGKELQLFSNGTLLAPSLSIHTEHINSLMIKFIEDQEAITFLKMSSAP